jgi:uncharacterized integral membrane protein
MSTQSTPVLFPERAKLQQMKLAAGRPPAPPTEEVIRQYRETCGGVPIDIEVFAPEPAGYTAAELRAERNKHVWRWLTTGWGDGAFMGFMSFCAFIGFILSSVLALIFQSIAPGSMTIGLFLWNFPLFSALVFLVCALIGAPSSKSLRDFAPSWRATHVIFSPSTPPCIVYQDGSSEYLNWSALPPWASGEQLVDYLREKDRTALAMYEVESTL